MSCTIPTEPNIFNTGELKPLSRSVALEKEESNTGEDTDVCFCFFIF